MEVKLDILYKGSYIGTLPFFVNPLFPTMDYDIIAKIEERYESMKDKPFTVYHCTKSVKDLWACNIEGRISEIKLEPPLFVATKERRTKNARAWHKIRIPVL